MFPEIDDPKDPHAWLTRGVLSRPALLEQALIVALTQLPRTQTDN
jgi:non-canonical (house-cleaning) NTP pyrophosphatase